MDANESERLARLEREMAILRSEFARLREQLRAAARPVQPRYPPLSQPAPAAPIGAAPAPNAEAPRPGIAPPADDAVAGAPGRSVEDLIGRYGTIAVATVTVLVGVGIFLNWAIQNGLLGPTTRVVLGYIAAIGIAVGGVRLRMRGTREFGNVLLAMALGVVHLVCWSAGPLLHVMPSAVALTIALIASFVLAEFALRHDEQALCAIGFGGAAIAPFVTSSRSGSHLVLALYGVGVVALAAAALGDRPWRIARRVVMATILVYTIATSGGLPAESSWGWITVRLGLLYPIAVLLAVIPFTHARHRRALVRMAAAGIVLGGLLRADEWGPDVWAMALTVFGTIVAIGALDVMRPGAVESEEPDPALARFQGIWSILDAFLLPLGLFFAAIAAAPEFRSLPSAAIAVIWTVLAGWMTHRRRADGEADQYASTASLIALWIVPAAFFDHELARVAGSVALGMLLMITAGQLRREPFVVGSLAAMTMASVWALTSANDRAAFSYAPFGTVETLAAALAVLGWYALVRVSRPAEFMPDLDADTRAKLRVGLISGVAATAFFWGVAELRGAWNPTASTALLIVYYAATGTLMIWLGRARRVRPLRFIGLGLALLAAGKAMVEAFGLPNVAVKIGVFFAVSAFLIAVGYWYRREAPTEAVA